MTEKGNADLEAFVQKYKNYLDGIPDRTLDEEPRFIFSGEIIPKELREQRKRDLVNRQGGAETGKSRNP